MVEVVSLTYRELADRLGITINSARIKARRRKWRVLPGNHPLDPARVEVPVAALSPVAPPPVGDRGATPLSPGDALAEAPLVTGDTGGKGLPVTPVTGGGGDAVVTLPMALEMVAEERIRAAAEMARALAERDTLHREGVERLLAQAAVERSLWLERIDAAECRAERIEQRLDQVLDQLLQQQRHPAPPAEPPAPAPAEPWWRRWLGVTTRSTLRQRR